MGEAPAGRLTARAKGDVMSFLDTLKTQLDSLDKDALKAKLTEISDELSVESIKARYEASDLSDKVNSWVDSARESLPTSVDEVKAAYGQIGRAHV